MGDYMKIFDEQGRLIIPLNEKTNKKEVDENKVRYVITEAYCPNGCSIIDKNYIISGFPALRFKFKRKDCEGEFAISAVEGDFEKILINGELKNGVKDDLYCPKCGVMFEKLVNCNCSKDADMVVVGLTPKLDFNNSITFCNVTGCKNGTFVKSGDILRHIRIELY